MLGLAVIETRGSDWLSSSLIPDMVSLQFLLLSLLLLHPSVHQVVRAGLCLSTVSAGCIDPPTLILQDGSCHRPASPKLHPDVSIIRAIAGDNALCVLRA